MDLIDGPITCEVTTNLDATADRCVIIRSAMAVDNQALFAQQSGAIVVIAITPVYCKYGWVFLFETKCLFPFMGISLSCLI